jgi:sarcosine oxidase subunit gamma
MTDQARLGRAEGDFQRRDKDSSQVRMLGLRGRFCVQCTPRDVAPLAAAWGSSLPALMKVAVAPDGSAALRLGPDEYHFITPLVLAQDIAARLSAAATGCGISFVDVSHRSTTLLITGIRAVELLAAGCPLDLCDSVFPAGSATRTLLGRVQVTLWRVSATRFFVEVWRSYGDYMMDFLAAARDDLDSSN